MSVIAHMSEDCQGQARGRAGHIELTCGKSLLSMSTSVEMALSLDVSMSACEIISVIAGAGVSVTVGVALTAIVCVPKTMDGSLIAGMSAGGDESSGEYSFS